ncbi:hypothetical protein D8M36_01720 [Dermabacter sp. HSID17554]|nr:hypothetical protein D8M36_01720 [Dermabacter sp. HSID17554]
MPDLSSQSFIPSRGYAIVPHLAGGAVVIPRSSRTHVAFASHVPGGTRELTSAEVSLMDSGRVENPLR